MPGSETKIKNSILVRSMIAGKKEQSLFIWLYR